MNALTVDAWGSSKIDSLRNQGLRPVASHEPVHGDKIELTAQAQAHVEHTAAEHPAAEPDGAEHATGGEHLDPLAKASLVAEGVAVTNVVVESVKEVRNSHVEGALSGVVSKADGIFGPLSLIDGARKFTTDIRDFCHSAVEGNMTKGVDSYVRAVSSGSQAISGGLATASFLGIAGVASRGLMYSGTGAIADGLHDGVVGVREHDGEKVGVGTAKTIAGAMMFGGATTANPLLAGGGAVLYGGALAYEHRGDIARLAGQAEDLAASLWHHAIDAVA